MPTYKWSRYSVSKATYEDHITGQVKMATREPQLLYRNSCSLDRNTGIYIPYDAVGSQTVTTIADGRGGFRLLNGGTCVECWMVINGAWEVRTDKSVRIEGCRDRYIDMTYSQQISYPLDGKHTDGYWYVYEGVINSVPTVSGSDTNLGDKTNGFNINYQVNDADNNPLTVTEKLNGNILRTLSNPAKNSNLALTLTDVQVRALTLNSTNTIQIEVSDGQGGIAYRNYTFRRTNTAPIINGQDEVIGQIATPFSKDYSITDVEGDVITVNEKIDDTVLRTYAAVAGQSNTITIPIDVWLTLNIGQHILKVEAKDVNGAISVRQYTFSRTDNSIQLELKALIKTDLKASKILVTPTWTIPNGATAKVEVCNNGFDASPTWEDATSQVIINRHYNFTNTTKTAESWGINIRFTITKSTATEKCVLKGFGGAFE